MIVKERDIACFCGGFSAAVVGAILLFVVLLGAAGCTSSRQVPAGVPPLLASPTQVQQLDSAALAGWLPRDYTGLPAYLVPPPPGSTAKQRRQWQKAQTQNLARAGVGPNKIKNSSVATAPGAVAVNRPAAPVATAPNSVATATSGTRPIWWGWLFIVIACLLIGWRLNL